MDLSQVLIQRHNSHLISAPSADREDLNITSHHSTHSNTSPPSTPGTHIPGHCCKMRLWSSSLPECHHIPAVSRTLPGQLPQQQRTQLSARGAGRGGSEMAPEAQWAHEPHMGARRMETLPAGTSHSFLNKGTVVRQEKPLVAIITQEVSRVQDRGEQQQERCERPWIRAQGKQTDKKLTRLLFFGVFSPALQPKIQKHWFLPEKAWHLRVWE